MRHFSFLVFVSTSCCLLPVLRGIDYRGFPEWSHQTLGDSEYMLYRPKNLEPGKRYPIALFMHGCCGQDDHATLRNAVDPPVRMWHNWGANTQKVPTYIISGATSRGWEQHFDNLIAAIEKLIKEEQGDRQRIYVTGFSMGGRGTWDIINQYPNYFAAALPMGMDFRGDHDTIRHIPVWTNRGETGWYSQKLEQDVATIRALNGDPRGGADFVTGVFPRITQFPGVGHGVQWVAASTQDLTGWAYSKINDGNHYPQIYFVSPDYRALYHPGDSAEIELDAHDDDGSIDRIEIFLNGDLKTTLKTEPFKMQLKLVSGDNFLRAVAYDNRGKTNAAEYVLQSDVVPEIRTRQMPVFRRGELTEVQIESTGNAPLTFKLADASDPLPDGLELSASGLLSGFPTEDPGTYTIKVVVEDAQHDLVYRIFQIQVAEKKPNRVYVDNLQGNNRLAEVRLGEMPFTDHNTEVNFSGVDGFEGLTLIQTDATRSNDNSSRQLQFRIDTDADLYIAYENCNFSQHSTIPDWLESDFEKVEGKEIVAQYFYFDVFHKVAKKGNVSIPGANAEKNGVSKNYFVMLKKLDG
ncbi:MAG: prolyl oligopeptidase family serine peptidase [Verrucomicrobiae bacterium]|nr:prolyl oligopeptidase family serine peptidase [Verrucomicrobiae bacterium]